MGVGGCSILCFTVRARLRKLSTIVLIFSLRTCSFSGPKMVDASLIMELNDTLRGFTLSRDSYRLDTEDLTERTEPLLLRLAGVTERGIGLSLIILDSKVGTLMVVSCGNLVR